MAGIFSKSARPLRPGSYFRFKGAVRNTVIGGSAGVVATLFQSDWGPENTVVALDDFGFYSQKFGPSTDTEGYQAAYNAFIGENRNGVGGAAKLLGYRMVPSGAAKATKALTGTGSALTLTALYKGTKGNDLRVTIAAKPGSATQDVLTLTGSGFQREEWTYAKTDITALAAAINSTSKLVTAGTVTSGAALDPVSNSAFTTGANGTLTSGDATAGLTAFERERFGLFAAFNVTDETVITAIKTWQADLNNAGRRFMTVVGGGSAETMTDAVARSTAFNDPNVVNLGVGTFYDPVLDQTLSTAKLTARVAGILAWRGESRSITFARLGGLTMVTGPSDAEILQALEGGVTTFGRDSHPSDPIRIEKGLTTYKTQSDPDKPVDTFKVPKYVRTMQIIETEVTEKFEFELIGNVQISEEGRLAVLDAARDSLRSRAEIRVIQPDWTLEIDQDPPPSPTDEFVSLVYGISFGRALEQVFNTVTVQ